MTNNNIYFIANWKMHGNIGDINRSKSIIKLANQKRNRKIKIIYCPPFTLLKTFYNKVKKSKVSIGAQNCHEKYDYGAFTGSINAKLIKSAGAKYIILGHSENRKSGETDLIINKKIQCALKENLKVIFCIGENLSDKKAKNTYKVLRKQLNNGLKGIRKFKNIIVAYEPVWSIGTGIIPRSSELNSNINNIKKILSKLIKSTNINILYGGSVNPKNVKDLAKIKQLNGFLIGGASLSAKKFIDIIKKTIN